MSKLYPLSDVISDIQKIVNTLSTQKKAAAFLGVSSQHLSDVLRGRREPGARILKKLGWQKVIGYKYTGNEIEDET